MTKREAKAVEIIRALIRDSSGMSDAEILNESSAQLILEIMQWQAQECAEEYVEYICHMPQTGPLEKVNDKMKECILNAGNEPITETI